jgi:hypothetical protein
VATDRLAGASVRRGAASKQNKNPRPIRRRPNIRSGSPSSCLTRSSSPRARTASTAPCSPATWSEFAAARRDTASRWRGRAGPRSWKSGRGALEDAILGRDHNAQAHGGGSESRPHNRIRISASRKPPLTRVPSPGYRPHPLVDRIPARLCCVRCDPARPSCP